MPGQFEVSLHYLMVWLTLKNLPRILGNLWPIPFHCIDPVDCLSGCYSVDSALSSGLFLVNADWKCLLILLSAPKNATVEGSIS